jgi:hypothetical protein
VAVAAVELVVVDLYQGLMDHNQQIQGDREF